MLKLLDWAVAIRITHICALVHLLWHISPCCMVIILSHQRPKIREKWKMNNGWMGSVYLLLLRIFLHLVLRRLQTLHLLLLGYLVPALIRAHLLHASALELLGLAFARNLHVLVQRLTLLLARVWMRAWVYWLLPISILYVVLDLGHPLGGSGLQVRGRALRVLGLRVAVVELGEVALCILGRDRSLAER